MAQRRIIKRLLRGQPASDHVADPAQVFEPRVEAAFLRPGSSQDASHRLASPVTCIDRSAKENAAVVAGEKLFKTIRIDGSKVSEEFDLRAAIAAQACTSESSASAFNDRLNIKAVAWSHSELDTTIIAASTNGRVTLYDLNRIGSGLELGQIREHTRQVHKLAVAPFMATLLLSACQDGTARLFDIRSAASGRNGQTFQSRATFRCNADAVRDVKWSPIDGFKFACSTASGVILHWDTRKPNIPVLKINAHDSACLSISWHPDGEHLISGGLDQKCYVWDLSENADRKQKAKYTIATPAPISIVSWRPPCWSSTLQAKRAAQVAVVYDDTNSMKIQNSTVHIWDVARPTLPFKEISDFQASPTGLLWHTRDLLWMVGREGYMRQIDVAFAPKVIDRRSLSTFDFSSSGEILMLLEERQRALRPRPPVSVTLDISTRSGVVGGSNQSPQGAAHLSSNRSDSEEDTSGSFLGPRTYSKKLGRRHSTRSAGSLSVTPPSNNGITDGTVMKLDEAVKSSGPYRPQQVMAIGHAPSAVSRRVYKYLSSRYLQRMAQDVCNANSTESVDLTICDRLAIIMEYFAKTAEGASQFRLAQTWRLLSYTMNLLLTRRAQHHRALRLTLLEEERLARVEIEKEEVIKCELKLEQNRRTLRPSMSASEYLMTSSKSSTSNEIESSSNLNTPLARPVRDPPILDKVEKIPVPLIGGDMFELPPVAYSPSPNHMDNFQRAEPVDESNSSVDGYDFYDMAGLTTPAINIAAPQRKAPFRLDYNFKDQMVSSRNGTLARHDSNESFQMFSTSEESHLKKLPSSPEGSGRRTALVTSPEVFPLANSSWDSSTRLSHQRLHRSFESEESIDIGQGYDSGSPAPMDLPFSFRSHKASTDNTQDLDTENGVREYWAKLLHKDQEDSAGFLEDDYLPRPSDPPFIPGPIDPHLLVQRTIQFETQNGCLNASIMVLLLKPFLSPGTLDDIQAAGILRQYHHRLDSMTLFTEAALVRKFCYPTYPSVYSQGQPKSIGSIGYYCTTCQEPLALGDLAVGRRLQKCYRCKMYFNACAVCHHHDAPPALLDCDADPKQVANEIGTPYKALIDSSAPAACLWWWCQGCGHGGHTACMRQWHSSGGIDFSDGCCPLEGCLHPCLPGTWREEFLVERKERNEDLGKTVRETKITKALKFNHGVVKRDERIVGESKAVETVRGALVMGPPIGSEREGKKSVKVVAPGEE